MLDPDQIELLSFMEERFWQDGHYPTLSDCLEFTTFYLGTEATHGISWVASTVKSDSFTTACRARGLPSLIQTDPKWTRTNLKRLSRVIDGSLPPDPRNKPTLTAEQVLAVNVVSNLHDRRSIATKLKSINVTTAIWNGWLRQQHFSDYFRSHLARRFNNTDIDAQISLSQNVQSGDLQSIKYYHELTGIYRPDNELTRNLSQILASLMEILAKYVSPEVLVRVADEFEGAIGTTQALPAVSVEQHFTPEPNAFNSAGPVGAVETYVPVSAENTFSSGETFVEHLIESSQLGGGNEKGGRGRKAEAVSFG